MGVGTRWLLVAACLAPLVAWAQQQPAPLAAPADGAGAYATGWHHDLFQENGHSPQASAAKVAAAFQQLFYGDSTQAVYFADGRNADGPLAYLVLSDCGQTFFAGQGLAAYGCQYTVAGEHLGARHAGGLVATNAVASLAATQQPQARDFVEELWRAPVPHIWVERYYDGLLYLMSLMHCSGTYRIWLPSTALRVGSSGGHGK